MAAPSLPLNEDINKCFSGLSESCKQNIIGINKFKKEIEKLKVEPEGRVATDKVNQWLSDLESLEGQAASILENSKRISLAIFNKIGPWGGPGGHIFDFCPWLFHIKKVKVYMGDVVNGLEITYEGLLPYPEGNCAGKLHEFELGKDEYINSMVGFIKDNFDEICIADLVFKTNLGNEYGPFGLAGGEKFTVSVTSGKIIGFFGQYDRYINSIGVWTMTFD